MAQRMLVISYLHQAYLSRILFPPTFRKLRTSNGYSNFTLHLSAAVIKFLSTQQSYANNVKISALSRAGNISAARQLFDRMTTKDVVSWNAIITGYWQNGFLEESKNLFKSMPVKNTVSWNCMIAGCIEYGMIDEAFDYFQATPKTKRNTATYNAMISGFVKHGRIEEAARIFEQIPRRNVISYTAILDGYMKIGEVDKARTLFDRMPCKNVVSWTVMISGYVENGRFHDARELFDWMPANNKNVFVVTAMITGFCKEGMLENARILFERIQSKDCVSFNAMIAGYAQNGVAEKALRLFSEMIKMDMQPDDATIGSVFTACSALASLKKGRQTHVLVIRNGFEANVSVCNAMITMYSKCGSILDSELAFRQICSPGLVSWNTIIAAFAQHGHYDEALSFFSQMGLNGFDPDGITFFNLLSACGHAGKVNESMDLFDLMVKFYKVIPTSEHYSCLVDILSRAGQLERACHVIQRMPFEADTGVWASLLAGCVVHLNVELGELAAKKMRELEAQNSAAYVMLSNLYAAAGMWREVTRERVLMKEQGVTKPCAYSWLEIGNKVHYFLRGDMSHPCTDKIHLELKRVSSQMKSTDDFAEMIPSWSFF